jgi:ribosomal protein L16 Arg81 hydroxylase
VGAKAFWKKLSHQLSAADEVGDGLVEGKGPLSSGLGSALNERNPRSLLDKSLGKEPLVVHGEVSRLGELAWEPRLASWETVNGQHTGPVVVSSTRGDEVPEEKTIRRKEATDYWKSGWVVTHLLVEQDLPIVERWCRTLEQELVLLQARCGVFSAQPGYGVIKHWDATDLLCIQLRGEKTWHVAPNEQVAYPTANVLPPRRSKELESYAGQLTFERTLPEDARTIVMKPGSVLYLPGGWWHTTEDGKDGLSLSFSLRREREFERVLRLIRDKLIQDEQWRAPVSPWSEESSETSLAHGLQWLEQVDEER